MKFKITAYHFEEEAYDRSNVRGIVCLPNSKTMMMNLIQSQIQNIMKGKVMKKNITTYKYKSLKCYSRAEKILYQALLRKLSPNPVTCM